jgi:hypothetical protein
MRQGGIEMPSQITAPLPGQLGRDYTFVSFGGHVYVLYTVRIKGGQSIKVSWKITPDQYQQYNVNPQKVKSIGAGAFQQVQYLGLASDVILNGKDHPFTQYLQHLSEVNGNVSWLKDPGFMGTMLQGFAEGWTQTELQKALTQTSWYSSKTQTQRDWLLNMKKADRGAAISAVTSQMQEILRNLYGPDYLKQGAFTPKDLAAAAKKVASGFYGTPDQGIQIWTQTARNAAEKIEGTPAWIQSEQSLEQQRAFMNRPEDVQKQLHDQALEWLGPNGMPDQETFHTWAANLVTGKSSQSDWEKFLQSSATGLYPWLGAGETWQSRASSYKNIAEKQFGAPINFDDQLLSGLGGVDANGKPTGAPMTYDDFTRMVRQDGRFWSGPVARDEGFGLLNYLSNTFQGVG